MNRLSFLKNSLGIGLLSLLGCQIDPAKAKPLSANGEPGSLNEPESIAVLRQKLTAAWHRSETMTMTNIKQMLRNFLNSSTRLRP